MSWSYSGDPNTSDLDRVRFTIGDTIESEPLLQDEEINYLIGVYGVYGAAQYACVSLMSRFSREVDYTIGPESVKAGQRWQHYKDLLDKLRADNIGRFAAPAMAPTQVTSDCPIFEIGMNDNKEATNTSWTRLLKGDLP